MIFDGAVLGTRTTFQSRDPEYAATDALRFR
jgi:hypothetical protein